MPQIKTIKVGIIDGAISSDNISRYGITDFLTLTHEENITSTHGQMILDIICNKSSNIDIYYVAVLDNNNSSDISNICKALRYLEEKDVDTINRIPSKYICFNCILYINMYQQAAKIANLFGYFLFLYKMENKYSRIFKNSIDKRMCFLYNTCIEQ